MSNTLSQREIEILRLISWEKTTREMANQLFLSDHTINTHRKNIMMKLKVSNAAGLVRKGFELGLLRIAS